MKELPSLIWFHNDMSPLGGAQREILTTIPAHKEKWNITFVTLNAPKEVCDFLNENNVPLITPKKPWKKPTVPCATVGFQRSVASVLIGSRTACARCTRRNVLPFTSANSPLKNAAFYLH